MRYGMCPFVGLWLFVIVENTVEQMLVANCSDKLEWQCSTSRWNDLWVKLFHCLEHKIILYFYSLFILVSFSCIRQVNSPLKSQESFVCGNSYVWELPIKQMYFWPLSLSRCVTELMSVLYVNLMLDRLWTKTAHKKCVFCVVFTQFAVLLSALLMVKRQKVSFFNEPLSNWKMNANDGHQKFGADSHVCGNWGIKAFAEFTCTWGSTEHRLIPLKRVSSQTDRFLSLRRAYQKPILRAGRFTVLNQCIQLRHSPFRSQCCLWCMFVHMTFFPILRHLFFLWSKEWFVKFYRQIAPII